jgi:hypothetical protein
LDLKEICSNGLGFDTRLQTGRYVIGHGKKIKVIPVLKKLSITP